MAELADARQRIEELEAQMERLKEKATAAGTCVHPERNHLPTSPSARHYLGQTNDNRHN